MIFSWFDATQARNIGQSLAQFFIERIPPESPVKANKFLAKHQKVIDQIHRQAEQAIVEHRLNAFKKAKLAAAFQKELLHAGYDPELVHQVTQGVVLKLGYR